MRLWLLFLAGLLATLAAPGQGQLIEDAPIPGFGEEAGEPLPLAVGPAEGKGEERSGEEEEEFRPPEPEPLTVPDCSNPANEKEAEACEKAQAAVQEATAKVANDDDYFYDDYDWDEEGETDDGEDEEDGGEEDDWLDWDEDGEGDEEDEGEDEQEDWLDFDYDEEPEDGGDVEVSGGTLSSTGEDDDYMDLADDGWGKKRRRRGRRGKRRGRKRGKKRGHRRRRRGRKGRRGGRKRRRRVRKILRRGRKRGGRGFKRNLGNLHRRKPIRHKPLSQLPHSHVPVRKDRTCAAQCGNWNNACLKNCCHGKCGHNWSCKEACNKKYNLGPLPHKPPFNPHPHRPSLPPPHISYPAAPHAPPPHAGGYGQTLVEGFQNRRAKCSLKGGWHRGRLRCWADGVKDFTCRFKPQNRFRHRPSAGYYATDPYEEGDESYDWDDPDEGGDEGDENGGEESGAAGLQGDDPWGYGHGGGHGGFRHHGRRHIPSCRVGKRHFTCTPAGASYWCTGPLPIGLVPLHGHGAPLHLPPPTPHLQNHRLPHQGPPPPPHGLNRLQPFSRAPHNPFNKPLNPHSQNSAYPALLPYGQDNHYDDPNGYSDHGSAVNIGAPPRLGGGAFSLGGPQFNNIGGGHAGFGDGGYGDDYGDNGDEGDSYWDEGDDFRK